MFRSLLSAFRGGMADAEVCQILGRRYNLDVSHPAMRDIVARVTRNFGEVLNPDEIAIEFLAEFTRAHIQQDHPKAHAEVTRYLHVANSAYQAGVATNPQPWEDLVAAATRFDVSP